MFATLLDDAKIPARRRLFMTAIERIFSARVLDAAKDDGFDVASMDDESQFGPPCHHYTFGRAIAEGRLADYEIAIIGVDPGQDTYRDWAEWGRIVRLSPDSAKTTDAHAGRADRPAQGDARLRPAPRPHLPRPGPAGRAVRRRVA
jgi:predicted helicase